MARRHTCGDEVCFHGAFGTKAKAKAKQARVKGSRIKFVSIGRGGWRYLVLTKK